MNYTYATVSYKGWTLDKDAQVRKAARSVGVRNETGAGFNTTRGIRDIEFRLREDKKEVFKAAVKTAVACKVNFDDMWRSGM